MCVGTRTIAGQEQLIRWFVGPDETHWPDWTGQTRGRFGRGVYTLRASRAVELAATRRQLIGGAALLLPRVRQAAEKALWDRLSLACRANAMAIGQVAVREALSKGSKNGVLVYASDAGKAGIEREYDRALARGAMAVEVPSGTRLAQALGREFVSSIWLEDSAFARDLKVWAPAMASFESVVVSVQSSKSDKIILEPPSPNG